MEYKKYYHVVDDMDVDNELLEIISEIREYAEKHPGFKMDFPEKCRDILSETDQLPKAMYNALVNMYYNFKMDK